MDKKSCSNCERRAAATATCLPRMCKMGLTNWQRDSHKWLSIPPEEEDLLPNRVSTPFFWKHEKVDWVLMRLGWVNEKVCAWFNGDWCPVETIAGEWQGPIKPV